MGVFPFFFFNLYTYRGHITSIYTPYSHGGLVQMIFRISSFGGSKILIFRGVYITIKTRDPPRRRISPFQMVNIFSECWFNVMVIYTLPETNSSHLKMDGWKTIRLPFGFQPIFRCEWLLVSGRVYHGRKYKIAKKNKSQEEDITTSSWWFQPI